MKSMSKKVSALLLALVLSLSLVGCGSQGNSSAAGSSGSAAGSGAGETEPVTVRVAALKGPTAMGLAQLMEQSDAGETGTSTGNRYDFTLAASADEVTPALLQGELDVACVPANLAAVLYQKTEGQIVTLAVNTLGVLYIVENGNAVESLADLKGKTIASTRTLTSPSTGRANTASAWRPWPRARPPSPCCPSPSSLWPRGRSRACAWPWT